MENLSLVISSGLKFFFLLTPFFVLSMFLAVTQDWTEPLKKKLALKIVFAAYFICLVLFFFGNWIFTIFGITLDSFRIGGGLLLLLTAIKLVNGAAEKNPSIPAAGTDEDIAVVPLAIPVTVGPATTGGLLILGAETHGFMPQAMNCLGLTLAMLILGAILFFGSFVERVLRHRGIVILSKITGLILAALASQMIFTGVANFLK